MAFSADSDGGDLVDSYGGVVTAAGVGDRGGIREALKMIKGAKTFLDAYAYNISQHRNFQRELDGLTSLVAYQFLFFGLYLFFSFSLNFLRGVMRRGTTIRN
jgi:catalase